MSKAAKSNLDLIELCDSFPYETDESPTAREIRDALWTLTWEDEEGEYPVGFVLDRVYRELLLVPDDVRGEMKSDETRRTISLFRYPSESQRSQFVAALANHWRQGKTFKLLDRWRSELWPVHGRRGELLFSMERAAVGLLGTMRYGVHLTAFVRDESAPCGIKVWVPKRAADKSTYPGMLDNTVAGGLMTGEDLHECVVREADEEASLPDEIVRKGARNAGTITYVSISEGAHVGESDFIYPECEWVYDLELPVDIIPQPKDGEVEYFSLCDIDQVKRDLADGLFKPNCALVLIDFFIRHGILTSENEPEFAVIHRRIHRHISFPGPHHESWKGLDAAGVGPLP